jgi:hypothetical protein
MMGEKFPRNDKIKKRPRNDGVSDLVINIKQFSLIVIADTPQISIMPNQSAKGESLRDKILLPEQPTVKESLHVPTQ